MRRKIAYRVISAVLAAVTTFSSVTSSVYAASDVTISSEATAAQQTSQTESAQQSQVESAVEVLKEQASKDIAAADTASESEERQSAAAAEESGKAEETPSSESAADTGKTAAADTQDTSGGSGDSSAAESDGLITDITQNEDGTITATDKTGGKTTVDPETGDVSVELSDSTSELVYNEEDAARDMDGAEYVGTDEETGLALYKRVQSAEEYEAAAQEYQDELEQLEEWADTPSLSGNDLISAMQEASEWDAAVRDALYEPVYEDGSEGGIMTADLSDEEDEDAQSEEDAETDEETASNVVVGYVLKEEYEEEEPTLTENVSFGKVEGSADDANAVMTAGVDDETSSDDASGQSESSTDDSWAGTTVYFVSEGTLLIRVVDAQTKQGINGASVTVKTSTTEWTSVTKSLTDGSQTSTGMVELNGISGTQSAFINISCPNYRGVTRVSETVSGDGEVLTFELQPAQTGEVYLRGMTIDGLDVFDTNRQIYVSKRNDSSCEIVAFVEKVNCLPSELPAADQLELCSDGESVNSLAESVTCADSVVSTTGEATGNAGYRAYTYKGQWNGYYEADRFDARVWVPRLQIGKTVSVRWKESAGTVWSNEEAGDDGRTMASKLTVTEAADSTSSGVGVFRFLSGKDGASLGWKGQVGFGALDVSLSFPTNLFQDWPVKVTADVDGAYWISATIINRDQYKRTHNNDGGNAQAADNDNADGLIINRDDGNLAPAQQEHVKYLKEMYFDKQVKLMTNENNNRVGQYTYDGSWDWELEVLAGFKYDRAANEFKGIVGISFTISGSASYTQYLGVLPVYVGVQVIASGKVSLATSLVADLTNFKKTGDVLDSLSWGGVDLQALISVVISFYVGVGVRGLWSALEGTGSGGVYIMFDLLPDQRARVYLGYDIRFTLNLFFLKAAYIVSSKIYKVADTKKECMGDKNDQTPSIDGGTVPFPVSLASEEDTDDSLTEDAPVAEENTGEVSLLVSGAGTDGAEEVTIASDGEQNVEQSSVTETEAKIDNNEKEQTVLENVAASNSIAYVSGLFVRIANVKDEEHFGGQTVPRVTVAKTSDKGIITNPTAIPATENTNGGEAYQGSYYGYDYAFDVYEGEKYYFLIISSSCVIPGSYTLTELAEANSLRLILLDKETLEVVRESVLPKSEYKETGADTGRRDYFFTSPLISADNLTEDKLTDTEKAQLKGKDGYLDQSGYYVASTLITNLSGVIAMASDDSSEEADPGYGLYVARGGNYEKDHPSAFQDYIKVGGIQPRQMAFANTDARNPQLVFTDQNDFYALNVLDLCTNTQYPYSLQCSNIVTKSMEGPVYSLQSVEGVLYAVVDSELCRINTSFNDVNTLTVSTTKMGSTTETNSYVQVPEMDCMKLLKDKDTDTIFGVIAMNISGSPDENWNASTDSRILVYTISDASTEKPVISGPTSYDVEKRQMFQTVCAIETGESDTDWVLRVLYLADEQQKKISTYEKNDTTEADEYVPGTISSTCNLYMWELHGGRAAKLEGISVEDTVIKKSDKTFKMQLSVKNVGTERVKSVTFCVTDDKNSTGQLYTVEKVGTENGIGLGSTATIEADIDIQDNWKGTTTLYAKILKVNGEEMSEGFTPEWISVGELWENGDFEIEASETGIGRNPYAHVKIINHSNRSFKDVALLVEKQDNSGSWTTVAQYDFSSLNGAEATGADDEEKVEIVDIPLKTLWDSMEVAAARFTLVGQNDITLNNAYASSETLYHSNYGQYLWTNVRVSSSDDSMGTAAVKANDGTQEGDGSSVYVQLNTEVTLSAEACENYEFDHWEIQSVSGEWFRLEEGAEFTARAGEERVIGENADGTKEVLPEGTDYMLRACFRVASDKSRITVMSLEKTTVTDEDGTVTVSYAYNAEIPEERITLEDGTSAEEYLANGFLGENTAYLLNAGQKIKLSTPETKVTTTEYDWTDDWVFDGFYYFTYTGGVYSIADNAEAAGETEGEGNSRSLLMTPEGGQDIYVALVYEKNPNPPKWVTVDYGEGTLTEAAKEDAALLKAGRNKILYGTKLKNVLPNASQLIGIYSTLMGYYVSSEAESNDVNTESLGISDVQWEELGYDDIEDGDVIVAVFEPTGVIALHTNYPGWGEVSFERNKAVKTNESGELIASPGTEITFKATPADGYRFTRWEFYDRTTGEYTKLENSVTELAFYDTYKHTMQTGRYNLLAVFEPVYELTVIGGMITELYKPGGFAAGDKVTISLNEDEIPEGYTFSKWYVWPEDTEYSVDAANSVYLTMPEGDVMVVAIYTDNRPVIDINAGEGGTVTPSGRVQAAVGTDYTITVTANDGYVIDTLTVGSASGTSTVITNEAGKTSCTYTFENVTENQTFEAKFTKKDETGTTYPLSVVGGTGRGCYKEGAKVHIDAMQMGDKQSFSGWEGLDGVTIVSGSETDSSIVIEMPAHELTITAQYKTVHKILATAGTGGSIRPKDHEASPTGLEEVVDGQDQTFEIEAKEGYEVDEVWIGMEKSEDARKEVLETGSYTFRNVTKDNTIHVSFKQLEHYTITATATGHGTIKVKTDSTVTAEDDAEQTDSAVLLSADTADAEGVSDSKDYSVTKGGSITFIATPDDWYQLSELKVDGAAVSLEGGTYTFENVKANHTIEAVFTEVTPDPPIDSGVFTDSIPYFLLLAVFGAGLAVYIVRKRRKRDE